MRSCVFLWLAACLNLNSPTNSLFKTFHSENMWTMGTPKGCSFSRSVGSGTFSFHRLSLRGGASKDNSPLSGEDEVDFVSTEDADSVMILESKAGDGSASGVEGASRFWNELDKPLEDLDVGGGQQKRSKTEQEGKPGMGMEADEISDGLSDEISEFDWGIAMEGGQEEDGGEDGRIWFEKVGAKIEKRMADAGKEYGGFLYDKDERKVLVPQVIRTTPKSPNATAEWVWEQFDLETETFRGRWVDSAEAKRLEKEQMEPDHKEEAEFKEQAEAMKEHYRKNFAHLPPLKSTNEFGTVQERGLDDEEAFNASFYGYSEESKRAFKEGTMYETDPATIDEADAANPGLKRWLQRGPRIVYHSQRDDYEEYGPGGPPVEVFDDEEEEEAEEDQEHHNRNGGGQKKPFLPYVLDIRGALAESGTNVTTFEECLQLGYVPGMPRLPSEVLEMVDLDAVAPELRPFAGSAPSCRAYEGLVEGDGGDVEEMEEDEVQEKENYFPRGFLLNHYRRQQRPIAEAEEEVEAAEMERVEKEEEKVVGMDRFLAEVWRWNHVEEAVEKLRESKSEHERAVGNDMRESIQKNEYSPGVIQLFIEAENELDMILEKGEVPEFPSHMPPPKEMLRINRLVRVYSSRLNREEEGKHGVDPVLELELRPFFTAEERTRWPWVPLPHWTIDVVHDKNRRPMNETPVLEKVEQLRAEMSEAEHEEEQAEYELNGGKQQLYENGGKPPPQEPNAASAALRGEANRTQFELAWAEYEKMEEDIETGCRARPVGWLNEVEVLQSLGIDPHAPYHPVPVGEGIDIWGKHPKNSTCKNTYCRHCYSHDWTGPAMDNPKFKGRQMIDLSNDELHELGQNRVYNSLPKSVTAPRFHTINRPVTDALKEIGAMMPD